MKPILIITQKQQIMDSEGRKIIVCDNGTGVRHVLNEKLIDFDLILFRFITSLSNVVMEALPDLIFHYIPSRQ